MAQTSARKQIFIAVAWPYVNGDLHIGHYAGYLLPADICARYHKLMGRKVLMVSGSDCHGTPITVEADKRRKSPQEIVEEYHTKDSDLFLNLLDLSYDIYTRTDTPHHIRVTQDFFMRFLGKGFISIATSQQYYSNEEKRFLPDRYIEGNCPHCGTAGTRSDYCEACNRILDQGEILKPVSKLSNIKVELKNTQHYFMDWSKVQKELSLEKYVDRHQDVWRTWVYKETKGWLKEGLKPRAITRDLDWGVPLPIDRIPENKLIENIENKRIYVWFDAVIGYYSASLLFAKMKKENISQEQAERSVITPDEENVLLSEIAGWWLEEDETKSTHYYFMGQDNLIFHTLFWPGQLKIYNPNLHLPDMISINKFLNLEGEAFSKSRGVSISIKGMVEKYGNDVVRFYLTYIMPETKPASFIWKDFQETVNKVLIGTYANFIHRVLSIGKDSEIKKIDGIMLEVEVENAIRESITSAKMHLENCSFRNYLKEVIRLAEYGNKCFDQKQVWVSKKKDRDQFHQEMKQLYTIIWFLALLSQPLMPKTSEQIYKLLGLEKEKHWPSDKEVNEGLSEYKKVIRQIDTSIEPQTLFPKITDEEITGNKSI